MVFGNIIKNKRADEGWTVGKVMSVLGIIAFIAIVLFWVFFVLKPGQTLNQETCKDSVVMRNAVNQGVSILTEAVPLKCKTEYVCYSKKGTTAAILENLKKLFVGKSNQLECPSYYSKIVVEKKEDIIKDLVERQASWWNTMGRGYMDYQPKKWFDMSTKYGVVGDMILADASVSSDLTLNSITYDEVWTYMEKHNVPNNNINYLKYIYGIDNKNDFKNTLNNALAGELADSGTVDDVGKFKIDLRAQQSIATGMIKKGYGKEITVGAVVLTVAVVVIAFPPAAAAIAAQGAVAGMEEGVMYSASALGGDAAAGGAGVAFKAGAAALATKFGIGISALSFSAGFMITNEIDSKTSKDVKFQPPTIIPSVVLQKQGFEEFDSVA